MGEVRTLVREFTWQVCGECGVDHALPTAIDEECRATGRTWWCPNGHSRVYRTTDAMTVKTLRADLEQALAARDALEAKLRRVENGVCPHCQRSFKDLHRHMKSKHRAAP